MADKKLKKTEKTNLSSVGGAKLSPNLEGIVDRILLDRIYGDDVAKYNAILQAQQQGTNYGVDPSRYVVPGADVFPFYGQLTASGFVKDSEPNTVYTTAFPDNDSRKEAFSGIKTLDPKMQSSLNAILNKPQLGTMVHEMAHVGQRRNPITPQEYERNLADLNRMRRAFTVATKLDGTPKDGYLNPFSGSGIAVNEMGAYLSQYEGLHPFARNVQNQPAVVPLEKTYLGQQILPPEAGIRALYDRIANSKFVADPEKLKYVRKMMGQERKK